MKYTFVLSLLILVVSLGLIAPVSVQAEVWQCTCTGGASCSTWGNKTECENHASEDCGTNGGTCTIASGAVLDDPLGNRDLPTIIGGGIKIGLGVVGAIALALFVYGGFMWMTAAGNTQRVQKGREVLVWATIGLIVIFTSYAILNFILGAITGTA